MGIVPPNLIPPGLQKQERSKSEVKDEHPLQEEWDRIAEQRHPLLQRPSNPDLDIVYGGGQSNRALLRLMKTIEENIRRCEG